MNLIDVRKDKYITKILKILKILKKNDKDLIFDIKMVYSPFFSIMAKKNFSSAFFFFF